MSWHRGCFDEVYSHGGIYPTSTVRNEEEIEITKEEITFHLRNVFVVNLGM